jgi:hypothetical protein
VDSDKVIVFMPALGALLVRAEHLKGSPLTEAEVLAIRDKAHSVTVTAEQARGIDEARGYADLDPQNAWAEWQQLRSDLAGGEGTGGEAKQTPP